MYVRSMQPSRMVRETSSCVHRRIFGARWVPSGLSYDDPEERDVKVHPWLVRYESR